MESFKCYQMTTQSDGKLTTLSADDLPKHPVWIKSHWSDINYKDALALTGKGKILRSFPLIPGIDVSGEVLQSESHEFSAGDQIVITGSNFGEVHNGGFSEFVKADPEWIVKLPSGLNTKEAMMLGTAGFTAALAIERMSANGQSPEKGPILVTGASGGVGNFAVHFLARLGYDVHALSGKPESASYLKKLGAKEVIAPEDLKFGSRPLESVRYAGAIDNLGGETLSKIISHIELWGNVACVGLAAGTALESTVMPFILRGVSLLGISSNNCPRPLRLKLWQRLNTSLRPDFELFKFQETDLHGLSAAAEDLINRKIIGRWLVNLQVT